VRASRPCGYSDALTIARNRTRGITDAVELRLPQQPDDGLQDCRTDNDCGPASLCACPERSTFDEARGTCTATATCGEGQGRCVLRACRDDVRALVVQACPAQPNAAATQRCLCAAETRAAMSCRILSCINEATGAVQDGRLSMVSR